MNAAAEPDIAVRHAKAELECLLLRIAHIECLITLHHTHPSRPPATCARNVARLQHRRDELTARLEQRRRLFDRRFGARTPCARIPTQLRRLVSRLFCRPVPMRHTYPGDTP